MATCADIFNAMPDNGFLKVRGRVENYQNNLQFIIEATWPAKEGTFEIEDLVPHTTKDIDQMFAKLVELVGSIQNRHLAAILQTYLDDQELMKQFRKAPAAMSMHHAFLGGLLEHTLNAMEVADAIIEALKPIQECYNQYMQDPAVLDGILRTAAERAMERSAPTLKKVKEGVGFTLL